jgi:hypothetical protein
VFHGFLQCRESASIYAMTASINLLSSSDSTGARGSVVGSDTVLQAGMPRIRFPMRSLDFTVDLILPAAL